MENNAGDTAPPAAEGLQVAAAEAVDNRLENDGGGGCDGEHEAVTVPITNGGGEGGTEKRKRGRPRKLLGEIRPEARVVGEDSGGPPQKRGRGRPRGSGKWQTLAASLGNAGETGGSNFTPRILEIQAGENIVQRIWSFSQMTSDSICILSASGTVSSAEIFLPASSGRVLRYEGQFTIVRLNGSHTYDGVKGGKTCLMSVQLAKSDGRSCGGAVGGSLIAAGPTHIILSTFRQRLRQQPSIRPSSLPAPNPNNNGALQGENGRAADSEVRDFMTAQRADGGGVPDGPNRSNSSSAQPADWTSLQPTSDV